MTRSLLAAPLLALSLAGCVSLSPKVPDTLLSLTPEASPSIGAEASGKMSEALSVMEPSAAAQVAVLRVPVRIDDANVAYLKKTMWVERPSRQFQHLLADTLRARGGPLVVENDAATTGLKVSGRLLEMGFDAPSKSAVVRFDGLKERAGGQVETRRFEFRVGGVSADAESIGPALNKAANEVAKQVADWVGVTG